jgi:hypothetical protein
MRRNLAFLFFIIGLIYSAGNLQGAESLDDKWVTKFVSDKENETCLLDWQIKSANIANGKLLITIVSASQDYILETTINEKGEFSEWLNIDAYFPEVGHDAISAKFVGTARDNFIIGNVYGQYSRYNDT